MTFAASRPSSARLLNCEMQVTNEKNTTGAITIFSAFIYMVVAGRSRYVHSAPETGSGKTYLSIPPNTSPASMAMSMASKAVLPVSSASILTLFSWLL